jgi:hypothetical protein
MEAYNYNLPVNFSGNKVEFLLKKGIVLDCCCDVSIMENLFEENFSLKLFDLVKEEKVAEKKENRGFANIKHFLVDKSKILINLNKSNVKIQDNCFINNNGVIIQINQIHKLDNKSENVFEMSGERKKQKNAKNNKQGKLTNKDKSIKANKKREKSIDLNKEKSTKRKSIFFLKSRFNESRKKKINPKQIKKKIPIHRLLKKKSKTSNESLRESKGISNNNSEYRSLLDKQTSYIDSK